MPEHIYCFIDSQNLSLGIKAQGWKLDYQKFLVYLKDKYNVQKTFLFIGYIPGYETFYNALKAFGYELVFKPTFEMHYSKSKASTDVELTLKALIEFENYDKALLVTGDGDFYCLIDYLKKKNKFLKVLVPNHSSYSKLLNFHAAHRIDFMNNLRNKLEYKQVDY